MSAVTDVIQGFFQSSVPLQIAVVVGAYTLLLTFLLWSEAGRRVLKNFRFLFYSESGAEALTNTQHRLIELEREVELLRRSFMDKNLQGRREAIQAELESQLSRELPELVSRKLGEIRALEKSVDAVIRTTIEEVVAEFLAKVDPSKLLADRKEHLRTVERGERARILEMTIEEQMQSAGRLKAVMINLFVLFNIGVLLVYLFAAVNLTDRAVTAIIGLYVSLAAFIVYIYRTSNFRSSVLLALREDAKKYFDADEYIRRLKQGASPTDRDVEVLKLLLLNRAEREKMADHPYEVVLKGVSNSNVQMKGGKIIGPTKAEK